MAETGARKDPFLAFRFEVKLKDISVAGFSECTGIQFETETQPYNEGGVNDHVHFFPTRTKQSNITLKRGIVDREMWDWFWDFFKNGNVVKRNVTITVRDPSSEQVVMEWQFREAFPCKWQGPDLNATQNNIAVETVELCHQGLEIRK
jgi:phage tail-like protein